MAELEYLKGKRIAILGASGMVGSAFMRAMHHLKDIEILPVTRQTVDFLDQRDTSAWFKKHRPEVVINAAARVGGVLANNTYRADFLLENLGVQQNIFSAAIASKADRLLFLGSSCIYPKEAPQPLKEEYLLNGPLEKTNEPYALAKIAGVKFCEAAYDQYNLDFRAVMPTNLYGPNDNYHSNDSHVLPALLRKFLLAGDKREVEIWGTGKPLREFMYVDDMVDASLAVLDLSRDKFDTLTQPTSQFINLGTSQEYSIAELAKIIARITGFNGTVRFNPEFPDGSPRKLLDCTRLRACGWSPEFTLEEGIRLTIADIKSNRPFGGI